MTDRKPKTPRATKPKAPALDRLIVEKLFFMKYRAGDEIVDFSRDDYDIALEAVREEHPARFAKLDATTDVAADAESQGIQRHKNIGAVIYDYRFRRKLPEAIRDTADPAQTKVWRLQLAGRGRYRFRLGPEPEIRPGSKFAKISVYEATPEIIAEFSIEDEQALLAKIRYNRLIDTFLGLTAHSLQNHLRTSVEDIGQIEIDELYIGHDGAGRLFVIPVQAKGKTDKLSAVQTEQDLAFCRVNERFRVATPRCVSAQFLSDGSVHLFEMVEKDGFAVVKREARYSFKRAESELSPERSVSAGA